MGPLPRILRVLGGALASSGPLTFTCEAVKVTAATVSEGQTTSNTIVPGPAVDSDSESDDNVNDLDPAGRARPPPATRNRHQLSSLLHRQFSGDQEPRGLESTCTTLVSGFHSYRSAGEAAAMAGYDSFTLFGFRVFRDIAPSLSRLSVGGIWVLQDVVRGYELLYNRTTEWEGGETEIKNLREMWKESVVDRGLLDGEKSRVVGASKIGIVLFVMQIAGILMKDGTEIGILSIVNSSFQTAVLYLQIEFLRIVFPPLVCGFRASTGTGSGESDEDSENVEESEGPSAGRRAPILFPWLKKNDNGLTTFGCNINSAQYFRGGMLILGSIVGVYVVSNPELLCSLFAAADHPADGFTPIINNSTQGQCLISPSYDADFCGCSLTQVIGLGLLRTTQLVPKAASTCYISGGVLKLAFLELACIKILRHMGELFTFLKWVSCEWVPQKIVGGVRAVGRGIGYVGRGIVALPRNLAPLLFDTTISVCATVREKSKEIKILFDESENLCDFLQKMLTAFLDRVFFAPIASVTEFVHRVSCALRDCLCFVKDILNTITFSNFLHQLKELGTALAKCRHQIAKEFRRHLKTILKFLFLWRVLCCDKVYEGVVPEPYREAWEAWNFNSGVVFLTPSMGWAVPAVEAGNLIREIGTESGFLPDIKGWLMDPSESGEERPRLVSISEERRALEQERERIEQRYAQRLQRHKQRLKRKGEDEEDDEEYY